jgi:hypothetical protein
MSRDEGRDGARGGLMVVVGLAAWFLLIAIAGIAWGVYASVAVWLGFPVIWLGTAAVVISALEVRDRREARRSHPSGYGDNRGETRG